MPELIRHKAERDPVVHTEEFTTIREYKRGNMTVLFRLRQGWTDGDVSGQQVCVRITQGNVMLKNVAWGTGIDIVDGESGELSKNTIGARRMALAKAHRELVAAGEIQTSILGLR